MKKFQIIVALLLFLKIVSNAIIKIQTLGGKRLIMDLNMNISVLDLKKIIHQRDSIPINKVRLILNSEDLINDDLKLQVLNFNSGDVILVSYRLL